MPLWATITTYVMRCGRGERIKRYKADEPGPLNFHAQGITSLIFCNAAISRSLFLIRFHEISDIFSNKLCSCEITEAYRALSL